MSKVLVESRQGSNLLYLPLDRIMQMTGQGAAVDAPSLPGSGAAPTIPAPPATGAPLDPRVRDTSRTRERETR